MNPPPNPKAAQARADILAYNMPLLQNPPREVAAQIVTVPEVSALVPSWPLSLPYRWHVEAHDDGVELWVDDEAALNTL